MMRFLVDAQLPPALVQLLRAAEHEAFHVADVDLAAASDGAIWDHAIRSGSAIVTKDEDFAQRASIANHCPVIVWIRRPNTRRRELLAWFERVLPDILAALERGETLIEVV